MVTVAAIALRLVGDALRWLVLLFRSAEAVRAENLFLLSSLSREAFHPLGAGRGVSSNPDFGAMPQVKSRPQPQEIRITNPKLEVLTPQNSQLIFIDHQPQMAFGVQSIDRQTLKHADSKATVIVVFKRFIDGLLGWLLVSRVP